MPPLTVSVSPGDDICCICFPASEKADISRNSGGMRSVELEYLTYEETVLNSKMKAAQGRLGVSFSWESLKNFHPVTLV